jgi:TPR repeat protein
MTLEEAKVQAEQGNIEAMMALADYYSKVENDEDAIDIAFHYYELAANYGNPQAIIKMAQSSSMAADAIFPMIESLGRDDSWYEAIEKAYKWAKKFDDITQSLNINNRDTIELTKDNLLLATSRLATLYYCDKKYDDVVRITKDISHPYTQSVYGLAAYQLANTDSEIVEAFNALKNIENDLCWRKEYQTKLSQILLIEAASYLGALYRIISHDVDSAYRVMEYVASHAIDESMQQAVREDMAKHFKKKLFGGYTYVE